MFLMEKTLPLNKLYMKKKNYQPRHIFKHIFILIINCSMKLTSKPI